jgi:hypothetical protein
LLNEYVLVTSTFYQLAGDDKRVFTDALKSVFLKTRSLSTVDSHGTSIIPAYSYGIFGRQLSTVELGNLQTAFLEDFRRWREVLLKASRKIVNKFREIISNQ